MLWVLCITAGLLLVSCREDITLELPPYESKLAVFCILQNDETPALLLSRSKPYLNYADTGNQSDYITDALVVITDLTSGTKDTLTVRETGAYWLLNGDLLEIQQPCFISENKPIAGHKYKLEIWHKNEYLHAETFVPQPVKTKSVTYTKSASALYEGYSNISFTLKFDDVAGEENAYITNNYRWPRSPDYTYKYDRENDGGELTDLYNFIVESSDTSYFALQVENQTIETAKYITSVYKQSQVLSHFVSEPSILNHNIKGGLGIFGAASRDSLYFVLQVK